MEAHESVLAADLNQLKQVEALQDDGFGEQRIGRPKHSLGLEKTKLRGLLNTSVQEHTDLLAAVKKDANSIVALVQADSDGEDATEESTELIEDLRSAEQKAVTMLETVVLGKFKLAEKKLTELQSVGQTKELVAEIKAIVANMKKGEVKQFAQMKTKTKKYLANVARSSSTRKLGPVTAAVPTENPFYTNLRDIDFVNVATSVYEAKAGVRAASLTDTNDIADVLTRNKLVKGHTKKCKLTSKHTGQNWITSACDPGTPACKALMKTISKSLDKVFTTAHILPDEPWAKKVQGLEIVYINDTISHEVRVTSTHFASVEARVYLDGETDDVIMGFPFEKVEGASWKEKRKSLKLLGVDDLKQLVTSTGGFVVRPKKDSVVVIPSGFLMASASAECTYLRWAISSDMDDTRRVVFMLETLVAEFPEIRSASTGYSQLLEHLKDGM